MTEESGRTDLLGKHLGQGARNFQNLLDVVGAVKSNVVSYYQLKDFLEVRGEIASLRDLLGGLISLNDRQADKMRQLSEGPDAARLVINSEFIILERACRDLTELLVKKCQFIKLTNPDLYERLFSMFVNRTTLFDLARVASMTEEAGANSLLRSMYYELHEALDALSVEIAAEIRRRQSDS